MEPSSGEGTPKEIKIPQVSEATATKLIAEYQKDWRLVADHSWKNLGDENIYLGGSLATMVKIGAVDSSADMVLGFSSVYETLDRQAESENAALPTIEMDRIREVVDDLLEHGNDFLENGFTYTGEDAIRTITASDSNLGKVVSVCRNLAQDTFSFDLGAELTFESLKSAQQMQELREMLK